MHDMSVKPVEHVELGDNVMGPDGNERTVLRLIKGRGDMYRITPIKGEPFIVNGDHILSLLKIARRSNPRLPCEYGKVVNVPVREYLGFSRYSKHLLKLQTVSVEGGEKPKGIDPYHLGMLIGDGCLVSCSISVSKPDDEIMHACKDLAEAYNTTLRISEDATSCRAYHFHGGKESALWRELEYLGLAGTRSNDKFIPLAYKRADRQTRLSLLAGLLDTDGHLAHNGYDWISASRRLADDMVFLCRSLGFMANVAPCMKGCQTGAVGQYFRVSVSGRTNEIPCRIPRKKASVRGQIKHVDRFGFTVDRVDDDTYYGFTLSGDSLYLDSSFIRHHNSGKSATIMSMAQTFTNKGHRCLVLTHVSELITQLADTATRFDLDPRVYAASLNRREHNGPLVIAQIQTVYKCMHSLGAFMVVFVDESHLINPEGEGMYKQAIAALKEMNPKVRIIGLSATPFRMGSGMIYGPGQMFDDCVASITMRRLITEGYLTPLVGKNANRSFSDESIKQRGGDYILGQLAEYMEDETKVEAACAEIVAQTKDRKRLLIFASSIRHAEMITDELILLGVTADFISGKTGKTERDDILAKHRNGEFKALVNCSVLTTGYDDPQIDCVCILRPTRSPGLFLQMVGRGLRKHPEKETCVILDFGGCLEALGSVDTIEERVKERGQAKGLAGTCPMKTCPDCGNVVPTGQRTCSCGHEWPRNLNHSVTASEVPVFGSAREWPVQRTSYSINGKKPGKNACMRVTHWQDCMQRICDDYMFPEAEAGTLCKGKTVRWLRDMPKKETVNRKIGIEEGQIVGYCNGEREVISDTLKLLAYQECFVSPITITTIPADNPKYLNVIKRKYS
jgi:superfamily II DNA or RNA helicase